MEFTNDCIKRIPFLLSWSVDLSSGGIFGYNDDEVARLCKISGNNDYDFWTRCVDRTDPLLIEGFKLYPQRYNGKHYIKHKNAYVQFRCVLLQFPSVLLQVPEGIGWNIMCTGESEYISYNFDGIYKYWSDKFRNFTILDDNDKNSIDELHNLTRGYDIEVGDTPKAIYKLALFIEKSMTNFGQYIGII